MPKEHGSKKGGKKASAVAPSGAKKGKSSGKKCSRVSYKDKAKRLDRSKKCGWARYFATSRELFTALSALDKIQKNAACAPHIPKHISDKYVEMIVAYDNDQRECSVCLEAITFATATLTDCGHLFHTACVEKCETCPECRGKYLKKPSSPNRPASPSADPALVQADPPKAELLAVLPFPPPPPVVSS